MKNVIIAGASGMIGQLVLKECLNSSEVNKVISIVRCYSSGISSQKLKEVLVTDFDDYSEHEEYFENIDGAYFCIGAYTGQVSNEKFKKITVNFAKAFVNTLKKKSPEANFCFLSGNGADRSEKSKISFARYKGIAENYILDTLSNPYIFRPAYIYPVKKRNEPNITYRITRALYPLIKLLGKNISITSTQLSKAIFKTGMDGSSKNTFENLEILKIL